MEELGMESNFLFYNGNDGKIQVQVIIGDETIWSSQKGIGEIFGVESNTITYHIGEIYKSGELAPESTTRKIRVVQKEGNRDVNREIDFYNLDMIIAVGYRVNSYQATQFRIWATKILRDYLIKGFALDDERLKQGNNLFNKDYFSELLERIREIRASERMFYQKITDIYALSTDYDPKSPITQTFFATVQNKLEFAITHQTAAEIIKSRADSTKPNMGLTTYKNVKSGGKILKTDVTTAKNYLQHEELTELNTIVTMYLDFAELQARRQKLMKMVDWISRLDAFLQFNEYDILKGAGKVSKDIADKLAIKEFEKYRVVQDKEYKSDFDKVIEGVKNTRTLPTEELIKPPLKTTFKLPTMAQLQDKIEGKDPKESLSTFNQSLIKALNHNPKDKE